MDPGRARWFVMGDGAMNAVFAHAPRTGGQSVRRALELGMHEIHLPVEELRRRAPGARLYAFVRNPWDRVVSIWAFLHRGQAAALTPEHFRAWVAGGMLHPCGRPARLYDGTPYAIDVTAPQLAFMEGADWIGRFERLGSDFLELCDWLGVERRALPQTNGVVHLQPTEVYDDATLNRIGELYQEDVSCFGYITARPRSGSEVAG